MHLYSLDLEQLNKNANETVSAFVEHMHDEHEISEDVYKRIKRYAVVVCTPSFFGNFWKKCFKGREASDLSTVVVKIIGDDDED